MYLRRPGVGAGPLVPTDAAPAVVPRWVANACRRPMISTASSTTG